SRVSSLMTFDNSKNADAFFSSSRPDDRSDFEVGVVHQNHDNEKGGISRPSKNCFAILLVLTV
ncbi:MAG: hypothetical protein LUQ71_00335, partial [Methanoregula sp.]|nr:hypothetical protein [Methanoregula sp.]